MAPLDIVRGVYDSHERRATGDLVSLLHPDVHWWQARNHPYANPEGPWVGIDAVVHHVVEPINHEWERFITRVDAILDAGSHVVVHGEYTGTYLTTGRAVAAPVCVVYSVAGEQITEFRQYVDTAQIRWAMGVGDDGLVTP